jgi:glycosyltransferase involved in cell wall biosynthesis
MHVLLVCHHALPHVGGLEVAVDREVCGLVAAGHSVTLVTSNLLGNAQNPQYPPQVHVIRVRAWHFLERRFQLPYPIFSPKLLAVLFREAHRADLVHAHGFMFMNSALAVLVGKLCGKPVILTDHGGIQQFASPVTTFLARLGAESVGRLSACLADRLVTYNQRIYRLLEHLSRTKHKSLFLPNPMDRELFRQPTAAERQAARTALGWTPPKPRVLFAGRLIKEKGVPILIAAADPRFELVFCGPGDTSLLGPLPRDGVEYLPPRPQKELVKVYHAADVLVLPCGVREGFPLVVQEALACGLNVVLAYEDGFAPYRGTPGLYFSDRTPEGVKQAIFQALAKPYNTLNPEEAEAGLDRICPPLEVWAKRLLAGMPLAITQKVPHGKNA